VGFAVMPEHSLLDQQRVAFFMIVVLEKQVFVMAAL